jgi:subtilase family serine protease
VQPIGLLNGGATSNPAATVEVFSDTVPGAYTLEACADGGETLAEINENNNCKQATGQITIQQVPNLTVTSLLDPPTSVGQGLSFDVNTTVKNIGLVKAKASEVKFNLVSVADSSRKDLKNKLAVPELNPDAEFSDQFTVVVRPETVPGSYRLEACADSGKIVPEQEENDNCKITTGTVTVTGTPDLIVQSVTVPAGTPSIKRGTTFVVTSIVKNQGLGNSGGIGTTTKFTLVKVNAAAVTKTLTPIQAVQALAAGASSAALQTTVTIPATTLVGQYQVQACADSGKALAEAQEGNNCSTSVGKINVTQ